MVVIYCLTIEGIAEGFSEHASCYICRASITHYCEKVMIHTIYHAGSDPLLKFILRT
jgi:hypothetical protein